MSTINNLINAASSVASTDNFILQTVGNVTKKVARSVLSIFASGEAKILGSSTGKTALASANTSALDYTATFQAANGTLAYLSDISSFGAGDMLLANVQSVTGLKTFDPSKFAMKGSSTGITTIATANDSASNYTQTLQKATGTIALSGDNTTGSAAKLTTARTIGGVSFDGSGDISQPYDIAGFISGVPTASQIGLLHVFNRTITFAAAISGSHGVATVAATAQTDFDVQKNGTSVGTIRFAASATTASFIASSGFSCAATDVIKVIAPATPDATLANIAWTLAGVR
jgi:hypothetical protein